MTAETPLWRLLQGASAVVAAVRAGESGTTALARTPAGLRAGVQALAFLALRRLGLAMALRSLLARRPPPAAADALLCTALALAADGDGDAAPYPAFTLVDQAVEAAKRDPATRPQQAFVNACLRRFLREQEALRRQALQDPVARWNHPAWWIRRLQLDHPGRWQAILDADNVAAPMTLRVNLRHWSRADAQAALAAAGIDADPVGEQALVLRKARPVEALPGFAAGGLSVQDAAAQLAAPLLLGGGFLPARDRLRVLDACAAPGGKTAHLLELADLDLLALDVDPRRCERISGNLQRLGLQAEVRAADAAVPHAWWDGRPFDAILLDAPCTASGIVRRHPDIRWLRRESDIDALAAQQERLLTALWPLLRPGGRLLFCTCSVFRSEGEARIAAFVAHNSEAVLRPSPGHLMPQMGAGVDALRDNLAGDHDGFHYALLEKRDR